MGYRWQYLYTSIHIYVYTGERMSYENMEDFYEGIKEDIPGIMECFAESDKVKRTVTVPKAFDTILHRTVRADLLRFHGVEMTYSDLLVGFAVIGIATLTSENVAQELADQVDALRAIDEARQKKK